MKGWKNFYIDCFVRNRKLIQLVEEYLEEEEDIKEELECKIYTINNEMRNSKDCEKIFMQQIKLCIKFSHIIFSIFVSKILLFRMK